MEIENNFKLCGSYVTQYNIFEFTIDVYENF